MAVIFESKNFVVESHEKPEIDRLEGGHIKISPKVEVEDRQQLQPEQAIELMRLTIVSGEAMKRAMKKINVNIGRINYQDNGNWSPSLHVHLYCRAKTAVMQKYGDPITPGYKKEYQPLNNEDIVRVRSEKEELLQQEDFSDQRWGIS